MFSKLKQKFGGAAVGALVASVAVAGVLAMPATAHQVTGGPVASASHGALQHVKRALHIGHTANRRAIQAMRAARQAQRQAGADIYLNFRTDSVAPGSVLHFEVDCDVGDMPFTGGGGWLGDMTGSEAGNLHLVQSRPGAHGWVTSVFNGTGSSRDFRAHTACLRGGR